MRVLAVIAVCSAAAAACVGTNDWGSGGGGGPDGGSPEDTREGTAVACRDGVDNDGDGWVDCIDVQCTPFCQDGGPIDAGGGPDGGPSDGDTGFDECVAESVEATTRVRQPNIIFAVDSSSSMRFEADRVQENINRFAGDIMAREADPRVVMIAERSYVVVPDPLGADPVHFLHIDNWVGSHNALGRFLGEHGTYAGFIHPEGTTHFVVVTDDESEQAAATWLPAMEEALGDTFLFHAIASPAPTCPGAAAPGRVYYQLADETGGLQISICTEDWSAAFDEIGAVVTESTFLPCVFAVPDPPEGETLSYLEVNVVYTPGGGEPQTLPYTAALERCAGPGWYYDDEDRPTEIRLCPASCEAVSSDGEADIDLALGCETQII